MRTQVLCDDYWHPARTPRAGLAPLEHSGFELDWIEHAGEWSAERMAEYPLVVLTKANNVSAADQQPWVTEAIEQAFLEYVRNGNGLLAIHSGTAGYAQTPVLRGLLGGVFVSHPPQCPVTVEPRADHPLTAGSAAFIIKDEHYHMALDDTQADLFLTTTSEHGTQPAGWTRREGAGRVVVLTPGHNLEVWLHPDYQALIGNALRWCGNR
jgi:type 1 glutamine amidotransferase